MGHIFINTAAMIVGLGFVCQLMGHRLHIPVILLLSVVGLAIGPILQWVQPEQVLGELLHPIVELAVGIILFEGGLGLRGHEFREVSSGLRRLFTLGVIFSWPLGALAGHFVAGLSWEVSLLVAAIFVVTGPTVITPMLRQTKLKKRVSLFLKWEAIVNDPVGALLAVIVYQAMARGLVQGGVDVMIGQLLLAMLVSSILAYISKAMVFHGLERHFVPDFLKIPFVIAVVICSYVISENVQTGAGLMTSTILGILIGNSPLRGLGELRKFKESITIFLVSAIFLALASSLDLETLSHLGAGTYAFIFLVAFVIRPIAIMLATYGSEMSFRERLLVGLFAPRGIVAASMAAVVGTNLQALGHGDANLVAPIVYGVIFVTVVVHGLLLRPVAKGLGLVNEHSNGVVLVGASPFAIQLGEKLQELKIPVLLADIAWYKLAPARQLGLPVHFGQIITDLDEGIPDLSGFQYALALNENDSYNSLVHERLSEELGPENVWQLPTHPDKGIVYEQSKTRDVCILFDGPEALYENMIRKHHQGWSFHSTHFSEQFTWEDFKKQHNASNSIYVLVLSSSGRLAFFDPEHRTMPQTGDTVIWYAAPTAGKASGDA